MRESKRRVLPAAVSDFWAGEKPGTRRNPYDRIVDEERAPKSVALRTATIETTAKLGPGLHVVDVGCATGVVTNELLSLPNVAKVTGIDVSPKALARAEELLKENPSYSVQTVSLQKGDILTDASLLPPNSFDVIVALELFDILGDPYLALERMYDSLKPGGHLLGSWLSADDYYTYFRKKRGRTVAAGKVVSLMAMPLIAKTPWVNDYVGRKGFGRTNPIKAANLPAVLSEPGFQVDTIIPEDQHWFHVTKPESSNSSGSKPSSQ